MNRHTIYSVQVGAEYAPGDSVVIYEGGSASVITLNGAGLRVERVDPEDPYNETDDTVYSGLDVINLNASESVKAALMLILGVYHRAGGLDTYEAAQAVRVYFPPSA